MKRLVTTISDITVRPRLGCTQRTIFWLTREHETQNYLSFGHLFSYMLSLMKKANQMTNNSEFHVLLLTNKNVKSVPVYGLMKVLKFKNSTFNVSSIVFTPVCIQYAKPWPHCDIRSCCHQSLL